MIKPNFIVIGTRRAATTWLHNCLNEHPEVFVPEAKELHFFDSGYDKGFQNYLNYFIGAKDHKAIGETTPNYLDVPECAERIHKHLCDVKLIVILRHPIQRAYSDYKLFYSHHYSSFEAAINNNASFLNRGLYHKHLINYLTYFKKENLLVLFYEDLISDNYQFIRTVYRFLEVEDKFKPSWIDKSANATNSLYFSQHLTNLHLGWLVDIIKKTPLNGIIRKLLLSKRRKNNDKIRPETREYLIDYYLESNRKLEKLLGRNLSHWNQ